LIIALQLAQCATQSSKCEEKLKFKRAKWCQTVETRIYTSR